MIQKLRLGLPAAIPAVKASASLHIALLILYSPNTESLTVTARLYLDRQASTQAKGHRERSPVFLLQGSAAAAPPAFVPSMKQPFL